jgi:hypothetical protein
MASQYQRMKANYDKYLEKMGELADQRIVAELERQLSMANTWDPEIGKKAGDILSGSVFKTTKSE